MIRFNCDYLEGAHPRIMEKLMETNFVQTPGYGEDEYCARAREVIRKKCGTPDAYVQFLVGGTQTNLTVIASFLRPYQGVLSAVTGHINADAAKLTGLCEGTPVCGGMFDIDACAVAMDVTQPNQLCTITGTWSINEYPAPEPVRSDTSTHNSLFCVPGVYLIEESSQTFAGNLEWFLQNFLKAEKEQSVKKGQSFYDEINQLVDDLSPADSNVLFLPFLYGSNTEPALPAGFFGLSGSHSKAHMLSIPREIEHRHRAN